MKKLLLAGVALGTLGVAVAQSQVNVVPQPGLITSLLKQVTYSAVARGMVSASSATDIFCLSGSTSRNVHITKVLVSGSGTAVQVPIYLNLNHSLDSGGTAYTATTEFQAPIANPLNPTDPAATATVTAYKANPTVNDTAPSTIRGGNLALIATTNGAGVAVPINWDFGASVDWFDKGADIIKASTVVQQYCLNLSSTSITSPVLNITFEWTEQ